MKFNIMAQWNGNATLNGQCSASVAHSFLRHALEQFTAPVVRCNRTGVLHEAIPSFAQLHSATKDDTFVIMVTDKRKPNDAPTGVYDITLLAL